MELWSIARYDLGLGWEEFELLTPAMFQALCKRRNIRIRYERYAHAMTASAVYNVNRANRDDRLLMPMDFVRVETPEDRRKDEEEHNRRALGKFLEIHR